MTFPAVYLFQLVINSWFGLVLDSWDPRAWSRLVEVWKVQSGEFVKEFPENNIGP